MADELGSSMGILLRFLAAYPEVPLAISSFLLLCLLRHKDSIIDLPVVGMVPSILFNLYHLHDWATKLLAEKGYTFRVKGPWFSSMDFVLSSDPVVARYVNSTKFQNFVRGPEFREMFDILGDSIITSDNEEWRVRRKLARDLMHQPKFLHSLRTLTQHMLERRLLPLLTHLARPCREKNVVDMQDVFQRYSFDLMCSLTFGIDPGSLSANFPVIPLAVAVRDAEEAILFRHAMPPTWWRLLRRFHLGQERKLAEARCVIDEFISQLIASRKEQLSKNCVKIDDGEVGAPFDLLGGFMKNKMEDEECRSFETNKFLRDSTSELLVAGWQTTSVSMAWLLWLVFTHPSVETKILHELTSILPGDKLGTRQCQNGCVVFNAEELHGCTYLNATIHETLRLYAPAPLNRKCSVQQDVLPTGQILNPGTMILLSLYAMGRMEENWGKDAKEFKPERWISKEGKLREESSYKFSVFSSGPRICLGKSLALDTIRAVAASVIYNFHFYVAKSHQACPRSSIFLHMKSGLKGSLRERGANPRWDY